MGFLSIIACRSVCGLQCHTHDSHHTRVPWEAEVCGLWGKEHSREAMAHQWDQQRSNKWVETAFQKISPENKSMLFPECRESLLKYSVGSVR